MNSMKSHEIGMTTMVVDPSQHKASRVAGLAFLFAITVVVVSNYGINFRLILPDNAVDTARNIMAHETMFRINIVCNLIYAVIVMVLLSALYVILRPINRHLALLAAFCRFVYALTWGIAALNILSALRLLGDAAYLPVFKTDQLQTLARLHIAIGYDAYYIGLPFWGIASAVCSYLLFKSRYIPKALATFGIFSSVWCVFCAFAFIIFPHFDKTVHAGLFDMPMVIFEIALGFWFLLKGLRPYGAAMKNQ